MARKRANPGSGGPNWLDTYSDMVTLLLTFFVMLFAMSTMDAGKWEKLVKAFSANKQASAVTQEAAQENIQIAANSTSLPSSGSESETSSSKAGNSDDGKVTDFDSLYKYLVDYVNRNGLQDSVHVHKGKNYTFLTFQNSVFFSGDSAELRDQGKKILDFLCDGIKNIPDQIGEIRFYGHTARANNSTSVTAQAFDRALSSDRAKNVLLYVQLKNIINPAKMVSEGYGEYRPIVPHDGTEATRAKNRRVEIYISKAGQSSSVLDQVYEDINNADKNTDKK
ncbi:OmpA family protein [Caproiciproducens galactitolivorans]|uniref:Motility protein B n=1 Tax=Caproiciproducens galactitolivorans TaxID=642589 RepID=A0A4Z0YDC7_9FIRM|nr:flagellar motor protein MotB [Caproiciproducens galactitolivorans]QEY34335.1 OmpA family protein [Caproiciproducens galactitolivorans]TGJ77898.1 motility protein B [Caproiciproducens galactitolivorans]